jgi:molecular chaperone GrpE
MRLSEKKHNNEEAHDGAEPRDATDESKNGSRARPGKVYEIPVEEGSDLETALRELEEHADSVGKKKRHSRKKGKKGGEEPSPSSSELDELKGINSSLSEEVKALKDRWIRSVAEFENYRKRSRREWELLKLQTKSEVILEILNTVDDFERALTAAADRDDELVQGIRLIYQNLVQVLSRCGVKPIVALNSRFDPAFHMAIAQVESDSIESGHVVEETQKGYMLDETVLRPAKVIIAK